MSDEKSTDPNNGWISAIALVLFGISAVIGAKHFATSFNALGIYFAVIAAAYGVGGYVIDLVGQPQQGKYVGYQAAIIGLFSTMFFLADFLI